MGKLSDSLLSGSYGRTGRLVVVNVGGTEILKHRPRKRAATTNSKQLLIQLRMKECYNFIANYKPYVSKYFGVRSGMKSPYNMAMSNLLLAFKLDYLTSQITPEYAEIAFSKGKLLQPIPTELSSATPNTITLHWFNNSGGKPLFETDRAQILYCAEGETKSVILENVATRLQGTFEIPLSPEWTGKTVHVWMAFLTADTLIPSNSAYAGSIVVT